jgi:hypothetical protein
MEKIKDKIQKLLNLSESNNKHESLLALKKARELMIKHNIEQAELNKEEIKDVIFEKTDIDIKMNWKKHLVATLKSYLRIEIAANTMNRKVKLVLIGFKSDVEIAKTFYVNMFKTLEKLYKRYFKDLGKPVDNATRNDYIMGFIDGVKHTWDKQNQEYDKYMLMVITPRETKETFVNWKQEKNIKNKNYNTKYRNDGDAINAGYKDGKTYMSGQATKRIAN